MDKYIVYNKELSKADILVLKNLEADIKDVSAKPQHDEANGLSNGHKQTANGNTHPSPFLDLPGRHPY